MIKLNNIFSKCHLVVLCEYPVQCILESTFGDGLVIGIAGQIVFFQRIQVLGNKKQFLPWTLTSSKPDSERCIRLVIMKCLSV